MADGNGAAAKRTKREPVFHVFRQTDNGLWELLTVDNGKAKPVTAGSRKRAVATAAGADEGTFAAIRENEWKPLARAVKTEVKDTWQTV